MVYVKLYQFLGNSNILPDLRNKTLMGYNDDDSLGNLSNIMDIQSAQLPNIVGEAKWGGNPNGCTSYGCFNATSAGNGQHTNDQRSGVGWIKGTIDASKPNASVDHLGNNVYTNNGEVRSANIRTMWIIKAL